MISFPEMLVNSAKAAGIKVPENPYDMNSKEFPHWVVYCNMQLDEPLPYPSAHHDNAKIIADILEEELLKMTVKDILDKGFAVV